MVDCRVGGTTCEPNDLYWADQKLQWQLEADAKMVATGGYEWLSTLGHDIAEFEGRRFWFHLTYDPSPHARAAAERHLFTEQSERERMPSPAVVQAPANNVVSATQFELFETPPPPLNERLETDVNRLVALGSTPIGTGLWAVGTRLFDLSDAVQDGLIGTGQMADALFAAALGIRAKFVAPRLLAHHAAPAARQLWIDPVAAAKVHAAVARTERFEPAHAERDVLTPLVPTAASNIAFIGGAERRPLSEDNYAPTASEIAWQAKLSPEALQSWSSAKPFFALRGAQKTRLRSMFVALFRHHGNNHLNPVDAQYAKGLLKYLAIYQLGKGRPLPDLPKRSAIDVIFANKFHPRTLLKFLAEAEAARQRGGTPSPMPGASSSRLVRLYNGLAEGAHRENAPAEVQESFWDWLDPLDNFLRARGLVTRSVKMPPIRPMNDPPFEPQLPLASPQVRVTDILLENGFDIFNVISWSRETRPLTPATRHAVTRAIEDLQSYLAGQQDASPKECEHARSVMEALASKLAGKPSAGRVKPSAHDELAGMSSFSPFGLRKLLASDPATVTDSQWRALSALHSRLTQWVVNTQSQHSGRTLSADDQARVNDANQYRREIQNFGALAGREMRSFEGD